MAQIKFVQHEIGDNVILTTKRGNPTKQTVLLGAEKVVVGVPTNEKVVKTDPKTGLKYEANEVVGKVIYKSSEQVHSSWFVLALETGQRGWYPGSVAWGKVTDDVNIKKEESDESETLITISQETVKILTKLEKIKPQWYQVKYGNLVGYIRPEQVLNIQYLDPVEL